MSKCYTASSVPKVTKDEYLCAYKNERICVDAGWGHTWDRAQLEVEKTRWQRPADNEGLAVIQLTLQRA